VGVKAQRVLVLEGLSTVVFIVLLSLPLSVRTRVPSVVVVLALRCNAASDSSICDL